MGGRGINCSGRFLCQSNASRLGRPPANYSRRARLPSESNSRHNKSDSRVSISTMSANLPSWCGDRDDGSRHRSPERTRAGLARYGVGDTTLLRTPTAADGYA